MHNHYIQLNSNEKVLISACLMGENVRYNGKNCLTEHPVLAQLHAENRLVSFCPECAGGLPTPRDPAEKNNGRILTQNGEDLTKQFILGAEKTLAMCKQQHIKVAILKENSPSCGSNFIYDGTFSGNKIQGMGVTAELLRKHNITVISEHQLNLLQINT